uniref:Uncharacterized protein n=1 Tax=Anguilla anguilla TaxID=7936 RepID=A0A0E9R4C5_ANGAN
MSVPHIASNQTPKDQATIIFLFLLKGHSLIKTGLTKAGEKIWKKRESPYEGSQAISEWCYPLHVIHFVIIV